MAKAKGALFIETGGRGAEHGRPITEGSLGDNHFSLVMAAISDMHKRGTIKSSDGTYAHTTEKYEAVYADFIFNEGTEKEDFKSSAVIKRLIANGYSIKGYSPDQMDGLIAQLPIYHQQQLKSNAEEITEVEHWYSCIFKVLSYHSLELAIDFFNQVIEYINMCLGRNEQQLNPEENDGQDPKALDQQLAQSLKSTFKSDVDEQGIPAARSDVLVKGQPLTDSEGVLDVFTLQLFTPSVSVKKNKDGNFVVSGLDVDALKLQVEQYAECLEQQGVKHINTLNLIGGSDAFGYKYDGVLTADDKASIEALLALKVGPIGLARMITDTFQTKGLLEADHPSNFICPVAVDSDDKVDAKEHAKLYAAMHNVIIPTKKEKKDPESKKYITIGWMDKLCSFFGAQAPQNMNVYAYPVNGSAEWAHKDTATLCHLAAEGKLDAEKLLDLAHPSQEALYEIFQALLQMRKKVEAFSSEQEAANDLRSPTHTQGTFFSTAAKAKLDYVDVSTLDNFADIVEAVAHARSPVAIEILQQMKLLSSEGEFTDAFKREYSELFTVPARLEH
jgi:hypothetical protein